MFSGTKKETYNEPTAQSIYITLFVEYFNKISNLEKEYLNSIKNNNNNNSLSNIKSAIKTNSTFFKILLDKTEPKYLNITIPVDSEGNMVYENSSNIANYQPQYKIILDRLETIWLKNYIIKLWTDAGGLITPSISVEYFNKYEFVMFSHEIEKKFATIDKDIIKLYKDKYYNKLDNDKQLRLNTYLIYLLLKNQMKNISLVDLEKISQYYNFGVNLNLLDDENIKKMFECLDKYHLNKQIDNITDSDLIEYSLITNENKYITDELKEFKINDYKKKYFANKLNNLLFSPDYKIHVNKIFNYMDELQNLGYELNSKQRKKINGFKLNLTITQYRFNPELWFPLFETEELGKIKEQITCDINNICKVVKDLFPYYGISEDFFCSKINHQTQEQSYLNQKDIYRTINAYCVIMIIIGLINHKLNKTQQNYQIIIKGGKALQLILSEIYSNNKNNIQYKSNDIDLIISPNPGIEYNELECKNLSNNLVELIKWILNKNDNLYDTDNYITSISGQEYKTLIKLSHKIQKYPNTDYMSSYTALVDLDYGKKNDMFYDNLVVDEKVSKYGKLLFVHQNLDNFVLEKIYYLDFYIKELNKLKKKLENKKIQYTPQEAKIDSIDYKNYERFINKFSSQIKQALKIVFAEKENLVKDEVKKYIINLSKKINTNIKVGRIVDYLYIYEK